LSDLESVALPFVEMAHRIVWASVATVDGKGRPRSRVLHPIWQWQDGKLTGWVATGPTPMKRAHLEVSPYVSVNYWHAEQDTCLAECRATWHFDLETRERIWETFKTTPPPVGYDPAIIPGWSSAKDDAFAALRLDPWRLRVFPGTLLLQGKGDLLTWQEDPPA